MQKTLAAPPDDRELVRIKDYIPDIFVDLRYATADNFTGGVIYAFHDAYLRYGTVKKLALAQRALAAKGYSLKIWDAYRPLAAQVTLWTAYPDPVYVADPYRGHSLHCSGGTVDVCVVARDGTDLALPSIFDEHSSRADRNYAGVSPAARENALVLQDAMERAGFNAYFSEWWHYSDRDEYPFDDLDGIALPPDSGTRYAPRRRELIPLRAAPDRDGETIRRIHPEETMTLLGFQGDFVRVSADGQEGYVDAACIGPAAGEDETSFSPG